MSDWIETTEGEFIAARRVVKARFDKASGLYVLYGPGGRELGRAKEIRRESPMQIIPAEPGWAFLGFIPSKYGSGFDLEFEWPVLGWCPGSSPPRLYTVIGRPIYSNDRLDKEDRTIRALRDPRSVYWMLENAGEVTVNVERADTQMMLKDVLTRVWSLRFP